MSASQLRFVQRAFVNSGTGTTRTTAAFASTITPGNLIVVGVQAQSAGNALSSITDTAGNTYQIVTGSAVQNGSGGVNYEYLGYAKNVIGGASITVTATFGVSNNYFTVCAYEIAGADCFNPLITQVTANGSVTSPINSGTLSIAEKAIIIFQCEDDSLIATSQFTGYTVFSPDGGPGFIKDGYKIVSTSDSVVAASSSTKWGIIAGAFRAQLPVQNNYQSVSVGDGMSTGERIR
jgi:hypothetical protein